MYTGYGSGSAQPWNDQTSVWAGNKAGYDAYMKSSQNAMTSGQNLTGTQNEQGILGLAGSGALQAAQNQWALAQGGLGNRNAMAGMNEQYYGGTGPLANYGPGGIGPTRGNAPLGGQPPVYPGYYTGSGPIGTH